MRYQVTNNTQNPRAIYHGGGYTLVEVGQTVPVSMLKTEADNAAVDGLEFVKEADALAAAGATRAFFAIADDAQGGGMAPLEIDGGKYLGYAIGTEAPTDPRDYSWRPVTEAVSAPVEPEPEPQTEAGPETTAGETETAPGDDALAAGEGNDTIVGEPGPDTPADEPVAPVEGEGVDAIPPSDAPTKAIHRGAGSYSVMQGDTEIVERLTKAEAVEFNGLSDDDKGAWISLRTEA